MLSYVWIRTFISMYLCPQSMELTDNVSRIMLHVSASWQDVMNFMSRCMNEYCAEYSCGLSRECEYIYKYMYYNAAKSIIYARHGPYSILEILVIFYVYCVTEQSSRKSFSQLLYLKLIWKFYSNCVIKLFLEASLYS